MCIDVVQSAPALSLRGSECRLWVPPSLMIGTRTTREEGSFGGYASGLGGRASALGGRAIHGRLCWWHGNPGEVCWSQAPAAQRPATRAGATEQRTRGISFMEVSPIDDALSKAIARRVSERSLVLNRVRHLQTLPRPQPGGMETSETALPRVLESTLTALRTAPTCCPTPCSCAPPQHSGMGDASTSAMDPAARLAGPDITSLEGDPAPFAHVVRKRPTGAASLRSAMKGASRAVAGESGTGTEAGAIQHGFLRQGRQHEFARMTSYRSRDGQEVRAYASVGGAQCVACSPKTTCPLPRAILTGENAPWLRCDAGSLGIMGL